MKQSSIMNIVKHANLLLDKSPIVTKNAKKFFLIFDKHNHPYLVTLYIPGKIFSSYRLKAFEVNDKIRAIDREDVVACLEFSPNESNIFLEMINVMKKKNSNHGLGTEMLAVMQMIGDSMDIKSYSGMFGNFSYLNKKPETLVNFYLKNKFTFPIEHYGSSFEKTISIEELDKFKRKTISYPAEKNEIVVIVPENKIEASDYLGGLEK